MNKNYIFLTILMILLAAGTLFLDNRKDNYQIKPEVLLYEIIQPTRYVTTDQVAKMIIDKDPTLELIDVRSPEEFDKFSLTNAINVPLDSIITAGSQDYFGLPGVKVVFYSNGDICADQAWVLTRRMGYKDTYVMKGGLNRWIETIIQPKEPPQEAPYTDFELYQFRKGAQIYFTGAEIESTQVKKKSSVKVRRRKKTVTASGGC
jgi:rhodanese-related sulfurtransferase